MFKFPNSFLKTLYVSPIISAMLVSWHYCKIFYAVIISNAIKMVNYFRRFKEPFKMFFHNNTMFRDMFAVFSYNPISIGLEFTSLPSMMVWARRQSAFVICGSAFKDFITAQHKLDCSFGKMIFFPDLFARKELVYV